VLKNHQAGSGFNRSIPERKMNFQIGETVIADKAVPCRLGVFKPRKVKRK
jgi:hypothetical protein